MVLAAMERPSAKERCGCRSSLGRDIEVLITCIAGAVLNVEMP